MECHRPSVPAWCHYTKHISQELDDPGNYTKGRLVAVGLPVIDGHWINLELLGYLSLKQTQIQALLTKMIVHPLAEGLLLHQNPLGLILTSHGVFVLTMNCYRW